MNLIFTNDKQSSFEEPYIANSLSQLSNLRDSTFQHITLENGLSIDIVKQACRLLKDGNNYSIVGGELRGELNEYVSYLLGAGLVNKDGRFIKQAISVVHRRKPVANSVGIYDYIEQRFITQETNSSNPFENVKQQSEQIDEDELLNDNVQVKQVESCATKPRACANCTCGRKEQEDKLDQEQLLKDLSSGQVQSSCGSCYLGDAFRCANCPYRGLPAFKQGDVIQVNQNAQLEETAEDSGVTQKDGKVKLQL